MAVYTAQIPPTCQKLRAVRVPKRGVGFRIEQALHCVSLVTPRTDKARAAARKHLTSQKLLSSYALSSASSSHSSSFSIAKTLWEMPSRKLSQKSPSQTRKPTPPRKAPSQVSSRVFSTTTANVATATSAADASNDGGQSGAALGRAAAKAAAAKCDGLCRATVRCRAWSLRTTDGAGAAAGTCCLLAFVSGRRHEEGSLVGILPESEANEAIDRQARYASTAGRGGGDDSHDVSHEVESLQGSAVGFAKPKESVPGNSNRYFRFAGSSDWPALRKAALP